MLGENVMFCVGVCVIVVIVNVIVLVELQIFDVVYCVVCFNGVVIVWYLQVEWLLMVCGVMCGCIMYDEQVEVVVFQLVGEVCWVDVFFGEDLLFWLGQRCW